jgi:hypothetical protein
MKLNLQCTFKRVDNILYQDDEPVVRFKQTFADLPTMLKGTVEYMQKYINMFPDLIEVLGERDVKVLEDLLFINDYVTQLDQISTLVVVEQSQMPADDLSSDSESHNPNSPRIDQVRFYMQKGGDKASIIASKIDAHPSYVQRLIKQINNEQQR